MFFFEFSPYGPQLILEIQDPEKRPFEDTGAWHSKFAGARKTPNDTRAKMKWPSLDAENVLTLAVLPVRGPDPPKSGNEVQFQNSPEKNLFVRILFAFSREKA